MALSVTVHGITVKTGVQTSGRQATADIANKNGLETVVYTAPSSPGFDYAILGVSITNRDSSSTDGVYLAIADSDMSRGADWIEWNTTMVPSGVLERTQLIVQPGQRIIVRWGAAPADLVPDNEILDYAGNWTGAVTGTGNIDSSVAGRVTFTLAEGDTGTLESNALPASLVDGETYRAYVSFNSTDVTGLGSAITLNAIDSTEATVEELIQLSLAEQDRTDLYSTYIYDFTVDDATGPIKTTLSSLRVDCADVVAVIDRVGLFRIS